MGSSTPAAPLAGRRRPAASATSAGDSGVDRPPEMGAPSSTGPLPGLRAPSHLALDRLAVRAGHGRGSRGLQSEQEGQCAQRDRSRPHATWRRASAHRSLVSGSSSPAGQPRDRQNLVRVLPVARFDRTQSTPATAAGRSASRTALGGLLCSIAGSVGGGCTLLAAREVWGKLPADHLRLRHRRAGATVRPVAGAAAAAP